MGKARRTRTKFHAPPIKPDAPTTDLDDAMMDDDVNDRRDDLPLPKSLADLSKSTAPKKPTKVG